MSIVVAYSPSQQGRAALRAAWRESVRRKDALVVASHAYVDPEHGRRVADEETVTRELAELRAPTDGPASESAPGPAGPDEATSRGGTEIPQPRIDVHLSPAQDVGEFLLAAATRHEARLLVIGLRGKSPIGKLNLGAAARRVVLSAPCPVLAVKDSPPPVG